MSSVIFEMQQLYQRYFGKPPVVIEQQRDYSDKGGTLQLSQPNNYNGNLETSKLGSRLSYKYQGIDIWLPIKLLGLPSDIGDNGVLELPYCTLRIQGSNDLVKTPMNLRRGTVKELFSMNDYEISIKGFFIDKESRSFPEDDIVNLKKVHEQGKSFLIDNAISNIFLGNPGLDPLSDNVDQVVITKFELPEVSGGRKSMRPFTMELLSDSIFILEEQ